MVDVFDDAALGDFAYKAYCLVVPGDRVAPFAWPLLTMLCVPLDSIHWRWGAQSADVGWIFIYSGPYLLLEDEEDDGRPLSSAGHAILSRRPPQLFEAGAGLQKLSKVR